MTVAAEAAAEEEEDGTTSGGGALLRDRAPPQRGVPATLDRGEAGSVNPAEVRIVRLPFLMPRWAAAQVLLPRTIFVRRGTELSQRLLAHELVHLEQLQRRGTLRFWLSYLILLLRCGYREHPLELDAIVRSAEPRFLDAATVLLSAVEREPQVRGAALPSRPADLN